MNNLRNRVQLIGHLGMAPEIKDLGEGKKVAKVSIAINESYKDSEGNLVKETGWHTLILWNQKATFAERYLKKGMEVAVEGRLVTRSYEDKAGNKKYITEIVVGEVLLLGSPSSSQAEAAPKAEERTFAGSRKK